MHIALFMTLASAALPQELATPKPPTVVAGKTETGKWVTTESTSPIDDSRLVVVALPADSEITAWPGKTYRPSLVIRLKEGAIEAYVVTGFSANLSGKLDDRKSPCTIRLDKEKAVEVDLSPSSGGDSLFFPMARRWIRDMVKSQRMVFRFTPFNSDQCTVTFDLVGLKAAIKPLLDADQWRIGSCEDLVAAKIALYASLFSMESLGRMCAESESNERDLGVDFRPQASVSSPDLICQSLANPVDLLFSLVEDPDIKPILPVDWKVTFIAIAPTLTKLGVTPTQLEKEVRKHIKYDHASHVRFVTSNDQRSMACLRVEFSGVGEVK